MSRIPGLMDDDPEVASTAREEVQEVPSGWLQIGNTSGTVITPAMMDEAFKRAEARCNLRTEEADVFQNLAARDVSSTATTTYYASKAAAVSATKAGVAQRWLNVKERTTEKQQQKLQEYATEFEFSFRGNEPHDHPMASLMRKVDHNLIWSRIPHVNKVIDVGGNPLFYANEGLSNVHVCGGSCDRKDDSRGVYRYYQAKRLAADETRDSACREMAKKYLKNDRSFVCGEMAQKCSERAPILLSIHVYDVPLNDWPVIMHNKGAFCVEGCMLFSERILTDSSGVMGLVEARFEVDAKADKFRMGFIDSPAEWYTHSWKAYVMYGSDHNFQDKESQEFFSYRIIERRADTIFFRILRGKGKLSPTMTQAQRSPSVDLVKVAGFDIKDTTTGNETLRRKYWHFPKALWFEMVTFAAEEYERGALDFASMYRYYRTVSVRQTINAVLVVGGDPVEPDELVPLVVHASMAAAAQSALGQRETRGLTEMAMQMRKGAWQRTLEKWVRMLKNLLLCPVLVLTAPLALLMRLINNKLYDSLSHFLVTWEPEAEVIRLPIHKLKNLRLSASGSMKGAYDVGDVIGYAKDGAGFDNGMALARSAVLRERFLALPGLDSDVATSVSASAEPTLDHSASTDRTYVNNPGSPSVAGRSGVTYGTDRGLNLGSANDARVRIEAREQLRKAAVLEHINEIEVGLKATESKCLAAFRFLFAAGVPNKKTLQMSDDSLFHPDVWIVKRGVLTKSVKGLGREDFSHMAVYAPELLKDRTCVRAVDQSKFTDPDTGERSVNYIIRDSSYSGYVLVNDSLCVFNGMEVLDTMRLALSKPHRYEIYVTQAPPGCGKTHTIKNLMNTDGSDFFACPVRESAMSTRREFQQMHPNFDAAKDMMRTVDSYLVNYAKSHVSSLSADRLLADELYMTHAGKWYAMAGLLGVDEVLGYGDLKQIPHIARVEVQNVHNRVMSDTDSAMWLNYRNPANAVAAWGHLYDNRLRAVSEYDGYFEEVKSTTGRVVVPGTVIMCMYQATKVDLRRIYKQVLNKVKIMTAHEAEGKTFDYVWLCKVDTRIRTDGASLYDAQAHCLVAASRHRKGFLYVNAGGPDLISEWVFNAKDPNRINAVKDKASAGKPYIIR